MFILLCCACGPGPGSGAGATITPEGPLTGTTMPEGPVTGIATLEGPANGPGCCGFSVTIIKVEQFHQHDVETLAALVISILQTFSKSQMKIYFF